MVSIIVVSYNQSQYISQILDSIAAQTYQNFELILGDDASTDDSVAKFNNWLEDKVFSPKKVFHKHNTGLPAVLNECVAMASGKYVKIIAADDYLDENYLQKCVSKMEELGEEYGIIYTNVEGVNEKNEIVPFVDYNRFWGNTTKEQFRKLTREGNRIAAPSVMMRTKALFETGPYDESLLIEDFDRWLRINKKYWIAYIPEKLVYYRQHNTNVSALKLNRIRAEGLIVKMKHDEEGLAKMVINSKVRSYFLEVSEVPGNLIEKYDSYPYHEKFLNFFMKNRLPKKLYKVLRILV